MHESSTHFVRRMRAPRSISFVDIPVTVSPRPRHDSQASPLLSPGPWYRVHKAAGPGICPPQAAFNPLLGSPSQRYRHAVCGVYSSSAKGPPHSMTSETFSKPIRRTFFVADLKCYMCGSVSGSVESEQSLTAAPHIPRPVLLRQPAVPREPCACSTGDTCAATAAAGHCSSTSQRWSLGATRNTTGSTSGRVAVGRRSG